MKGQRITAFLLALIMMFTMAACGKDQEAAAPETQQEEETKNETEEAKEPEKPEKEEETADNKDGVTITFWHSMGGVNGEATEHLIDKFNKENDKGITVEAQYQGNYDDAINKLKSAQIGNMGADLVQVYDIGTRFMIDSGWIIPMQDLIDKYGYDISQIEPNIAAYYTVDDKLYSMPFNSSTPLLYYNKDLFDAAGIEEPPKTFDEIAEISPALQKAGAGHPMALSIYAWFFEQFMCKQGLDFVDQDNGRSGPATKVMFDENGGGEKILSAWKKLYDADFAPNVGVGDDSGLSDFTSGNAAMTLASTASLKQILLDVDGKFEVGTAYLPAVTEDSVDGGVSIGGASLWALNNEDPEKEEATWEFVKFLISPETQAYWNKETGYFPVTVAAHEEDVFKENIEKYPQFQTAIDQLHDSTPESQGALLSVFPESRKVVEAEIEKMLLEDRSPAETVDIIAEKINKSIEEYNLLNE